jgi:hypothetical protein
MRNSTERQMPERSMHAAVQYGEPDVDQIANVLSLQKLEVAEDDPWFGNSCTSSLDQCCDTGGN